MNGSGRSGVRLSEREGGGQRKEKVKQRMGRMGRIKNGHQIIN